MKFYVNPASIPAIEAKKEPFVPKINSSKKSQLDFKINAKNKFENDTKNSYIDSIKISAYTSISPKHTNSENQKLAIESWHKLGIEVYSLNASGEIEALEKEYPEYVNFIPCNKNSKHIFGKPCILINEMMDHFIENKSGDVLILINSDIILNLSEELLNKIKSISENCIPISNRQDYRDNISVSKKYIYGFDVFFINKKYIQLFPQSIYSMGQTWWDYWIPFIALKNNTDVLILQEQIAFHKEHQTQYRIRDWIKMTEYFKWENDISSSQDYQAINDNVHRHITTNSMSFFL